MSVFYHRYWPTTTAYHIGYGIAFPNLLPPIQAHASVNNLYLLLTFMLIVPLAVTLLELLLLVVGLPTVPNQTLLIRLLLPQPNADWSGGWIQLICLPGYPLLTRLVNFTDSRQAVDVPRNDTQLVGTAARGANSLQCGFGCGQLLWLMFVAVPLLSLSLVDRRVERSVPMREPPIKRGLLWTRKVTTWSALNDSCDTLSPSLLDVLFGCERPHHSLPHPDM